MRARHDTCVGVNVVSVAVNK